MATYDPRHLAGVLFFNAGDYFEAHEVWEDLWAESHGGERRFYQGLIQAAVGLFHFGNGNHGGAVKLYHSSRDYLRPCGAAFQGVDLDAFGRAMEACFRPLLAGGADRALRPDPALRPALTLDPPPDDWPDPEDFLPDEDD
jgi:hypothetical protein